MTARGAPVSVCHSRVGDARGFAPSSNFTSRLNADAEVFARSSRLLQLIEQSVVYGAKMVNRDRLRAAALTRNVQIWIDQLQASYGPDPGPGPGPGPGPDSDPDPGPGPGAGPAPWP